jgi:hypothetical protein
MKNLVEKHNISLIHGRPYHPQSKGKCERVNRTLKQKIKRSTSGRSGFNWAKSLKYLATSINTSVHQNLGYYTPFQVYFGRFYTADPMSPLQRKIMNKKTKKQERVYTNRLQKFARKSVYKQGEEVFIRYQFKKSRILTRRLTLKGKVLKAGGNGNRYLVSYTLKNGDQEKDWIDVQHITSMTRHLESVRYKNLRFGISQMCTKTETS